MCTIFSLHPVDVNVRRYMYTRANVCVLDAINLEGNYFPLTIK